MSAVRLLALDVDGVLTDGRVTYSASGEETKTVSYHDIDGVFQAHRAGLIVALVSAEDSPWLTFISGRLQARETVRGAKDKLAALKALAERHQTPLENVCFIGDSDRDAPAIAAAGWGFAPANATPKAKAAAKRVLERAGGFGAVHEAVSRLLSADAER